MGSWFQASERKRSRSELHRRNAKSAMGPIKGRSLREAYRHGNRGGSKGRRSAVSAGVAFRLAGSKRPFRGLLESYIKRHRCCYRYYNRYFKEYCRVTSSSIIK